MKKLPSKLNIITDESSNYLDYFDGCKCPIAMALKKEGFSVGRKIGNIYVGSNGTIHLRQSSTPSLERTSNTCLGQYRFPGGKIVSFQNPPKGELHLHSVDE